MTREDAIRCVSHIIDYCREHGLEEFENDLYSLLDAITEEVNQDGR